MSEAGPSTTRPRVALIATTYHAVSHADVLGTRLIEGYEWRGSHVPSRVEVASLYVEQSGATSATGHRPDIGAEIAQRNGIPVFATIAEAIGLGCPGVAVDGVVLIGEHGDYELNQYGQKLYPRRRFFDAAVAAMVSSGRFVPVFNDKHLAWNFVDASAMWETARRLGIPLLAGSTVPLTWRSPTGAQWPIGEPMRSAVAVGYGPAEAYDFHILEGLQTHAERRAGGETGVRSVRTLSGAGALHAVQNGTVDAGLLDTALGALGLDRRRRELAIAGIEHVILIEYADGLRAAAVNCGQEVANFAAACAGPGGTMACQTVLEDEPWGHFVFLARQVEALVLTGTAPYPVERTLLTTGVLDAAMRSLHAGGEEVVLPLDISYAAVSDIPDTGIDAEVSVLQ
ncbi:hypothetical protein [Kribbella sp. NPDC050459]|uniref:hypothetical protein n=1 Tax=Kribbella sp. NPDC050459 TaxID=3155785 RepID=UPI0033CB3FC7